MSQYRISRNLEASLIDYIEEQLQLASWSNITVEKSWVKAYDTILESGQAMVVVHLTDTTHTWVELGSKSTYRIPLIIIDLYCSSDGQRLDLKDFLIDILKGGCDYFTYEIIDGVKTKTEDGKINVLEITDTEVIINDDKATLDAIDRYRHRLVLTVSLGKVET